MVDEKVITLIKQYLAQLKLEGIVVTKAILFGSHAADDADENSDIDLLIVSPQFDDNGDKYVGKLWKATKCSDYKIEPIGIGEIKFNTGDSSPIISAAKKYGLEIAA
ncbi:nucleotidyltransferase domain-containing protein [Bacteroidota bacterium]